MDAGQVIQTYQTTIKLREGEDSVQLLAVPKTLPAELAPDREHHEIALTNLAQNLGFDEYYKVFNPLALHSAIEAILTTPRSYDDATFVYRERAEATQLVEEDYKRREFAAYVAFAEILPYKRSPLVETSLAGLVAGSSYPLSAQLTRGYDAVYLMILTQTGLVLLASTPNLSRALSEGLEKRVMRFATETRPSMITTYDHKAFVASAR